MNKPLNSLNNFLFMRTKGSKIANFSLLALVGMYAAILLYPNFLFAHTFTYQGFTIHSTQPIGDRILAVITKAEQNLSGSEIYDNQRTHHIYLCNGYSLYAFLAPQSRKAFACNYPLINNIFIANCSAEKNEAYKYNEDDQYSRQLSALISHEITHTFIEKRIGYWKFRTLSEWKNEGYCDYVGYGKKSSLNEIKSSFGSIKTDARPGTVYRKYYYAVSYLIDVEHMTFDQIVSTPMSFDEVCDKIQRAGE